MRALVTLLAGALAAGCATESQAIDPSVARPPSFAELQREIDAVSDCTPQYFVRLSAGETPLPRPLTRCPVVYADTLRHAGIEGACMTMFDLDSQGQPVRMEAHCNVRRKDADISGEWRAVAQKAFVYAAERLAGQSRYAPEGDPSMAGKFRTNIAMGVNFEFEGERSPVESPPPFMRASPAPAPTPEQSEFYARLASNRAAHLANSSNPQANPN